MTHNEASAAADTAAVINHNLDRVMREVNHFTTQLLQADAPAALVAEQPEMITDERMNALFCLSIAWALHSRGIEAPLWCDVPRFAAANFWVRPRDLAGLI